jgi:hypothetical protein
MTPTTSSEHRARESWLHTNIQNCAHENFPDNTHNVWTILSFDHRGADTCLVEARPDPDDVGYPSFKFWFLFRKENDTAGCVATYCFEDGRYSLLCCEPEWSDHLPTEM